MNWFQSICRNLGLMVHNVKHPEGPPESPPPPEATPEDAPRREVKRTVQEKRHGNMVLRRTTIDEVEYHHDPADENKPAHD